MQHNITTETRDKIIKALNDGSYYKKEILKWLMLI
jgi:hypothetical protein